MLFRLFHFLIAVSLLNTNIGVSAAPQHAVNQIPRSFSLSLRRRLFTGSTEVMGYTDNTEKYAWLVDVLIRGQTFSLELDTESQTS